MTVDIFRQLKEYFRYFSLFLIVFFMPFFCGGLIVVVGIRAVGKVINRGGVHD